MIVFTVLTIGFTACQNEKKKAEEVSNEEVHAVDDGNNHKAESKKVHLNDSTKAESHEGHNHAVTDTNHKATDRHNH